jgi:phospholipid transport system substrate-binding protein
MHRRQLFGALTAAGAWAILPDVGAAQAETSARGAVPAAETFVSSLAARGIASLTTADIGQAERARRFRALLVENFDVPTIGRFVLGRYWRTASETERADYLRLFEDVMVMIYSARFAEYSGEQIRVTGSRTTAQDDIVVASYAVLPRQSQDPLSVDWILRRDGEGFRIMDLRAEGVSMAITQRDEFASLIQRYGGTITALLTTLRQRFAQR